VRPHRSRIEGSVLLLFLAVVVLAVVAIAAFRRASGIPDLAARIGVLEQEIADLKRRVRALRQEVRPAETGAVAPESKIAPPSPPPPPTPAASPAREEQPPPEPPAPPFDWERWIGIRGAAVLGAVVLALAGLLFFQYSIQHGLITPPMRVVLGIAVGLACIGASEWMRPRGYRVTPEGLAGAGVIVLYGAFWAGHALYHLIPLTLAFVLMVLVTAACGLLAVRRASPLVAVLGLFGGFATPLLLSSGADHPIGLFGYVLLLDFGLLAVGHRLRWAWLTLLGLGGTLLLQALWIVFRMGPHRLGPGLVILGVFAVLFAASGFWARAEDRPGWRFGQAGGLLLPFLFAIYFAARVDLGPHLWRVAILVVLLDVAASWTSRRIGLRELAPAAALASVGVLAVWTLNHTGGQAAAWEAAAIAAVFAAIFQAFVETDREGEPASGSRTATLIAAGGATAVLLLASTVAAGVPPWPWLAGWLALAAVLSRLSTSPGLAVVQLAAAAGPALGLSLQHVVHADDPAFPSGGLFLAAVVAVAAAAQVVALVRRGGEAHRMAEHAAAAVACVLSASLVASPLLASLPMGLALGTPLVLGTLALLAATRIPEGGWGPPALLATVIVHAAWIFATPLDALAAGNGLAALGFGIAGVVLFTVWPFLAGERYGASPRGWQTAALAGPVWFLPLKHVWPAVLGGGSIGLLPVVLGAIALAATFGARRASIASDGVRRGALAFLAAVAICFASIAIPLQLEKSWVTIGWALEGLALVALWRRLDHPGLKWFALAHLAASVARLVPTEALLGSYPRPAVPILNWVLYTYLVPAAALFASAWLLAPEEVARARDAEREIYRGGRAIGATAASVAGIFVVFVWINLAIADWYAQGTRLTLSFGHSPARNLTVSIAWAIYALILLGVGMARSSSGLRWLSLGFLIVTIGKVFLYDLGELQDLYRVVSLVGLALSLLFVSILYQRFVFRRRQGDPS
jgi:Predicted membrane protein (DUF2339)